MNIHPGREAARKGNLLVVDDDPDAAVVLSLILQSEGYTVETATSCAEALETVDDRPELDAVVSDVRMPDVDGFMLHRVLKLRRPDLRVVLVTGHPVDRVADVVPRDATVLPKPVDVAALVHALQAA